MELHQKEQYKYLQLRQTLFSQSGRFLEHSWLSEVENEDLDNLYD
jgi:hypothetical protein